MKVYMKKFSTLTHLSFSVFCLLLLYPLQFFIQAIYVRIYIYIYMCVYIYIYIYTHIYKYIYIYTHINVEAIILEYHKILTEAKYLNKTTSKSYSFYAGSN